MEGIDEISSESSISLFGCDLGGSLGCYFGCYLGCYFYLGSSKEMFLLGTLILDSAFSYFSFSIMEVRGLGGFFYIVETVCLILDWNWLGLDILLYAPPKRILAIESKSYCSMSFETSGIDPSVFFFELTVKSPKSSSSSIILRLRDCSFIATLLMLALDWLFFSYFDFYDLFKLSPITSGPCLIISE